MSADSTVRRDRRRLGRWWIVGAVLASIALGGGAAFLVNRLAHRPKHHVAAHLPGTKRSVVSDLVIALQAEGEAFPAIAVLTVGQNGGAIVLLPATTVVEVPGVGPRTLAQALVQTGPDGLGVSIANALRIKTPPVLVGDPSHVAAVIDEAGGVSVDVPEDVVEDDNGTTRTVYTRGVAHMNGADFVRYQTTALPGVAEIDRTTRQGAGWRAILAALSGPQAVQSLRSWGGNVSPEAAAGLIARVAGRDVMTLQVNRLGPQSDDLYQINENDIGALREALSAVTTAPSALGHRVRLLVGADGNIGPAVARTLVDAGYVIVLSGKSAKPYDRTEVVIAQVVGDPETLGTAIVELLGVGRVSLSDQPTTVADIMLVVGRDWAEANGFPQH